MALVKNKNRNPVAAVAAAAAADGIPRSPFDEKFPTARTTASSTLPPAGLLISPLTTATTLLCSHQRRCSTLVH